MTRKAWNKLLDLELIIGMIVSIIVGIVGENLPQLYWSRLCWIALIILVITFALKFWGKKNPSVKLVDQWFSNLTLILIFNFLIYTTVSMLNLVAKPLSPISSGVGMLLFLVVDIPVVVVNFPIVKNWLMRLFMIFLLFVNYSYNINRMIGAPAIIKQMNQSGIMVAIATFILTFFITKAWQLKFNWNLKLSKDKNFSWLTLVLLLIVSVWFAFFNSFIVLVQSLSDLICFWTWDLSTFEVTVNAVLRAADAGIFEETIRYLNLVILLVAMRQFKYRLVGAAVASSVLFSLGHLSNLGSTVSFVQFDLEATLQQLVYTFGMGMLLVAIYLYTGKLWLSMLVHGLVDLVVFCQTPLTRIGNPLVTNGWEASVIMMSIPLAIAVVMMTGKRKKLMEDNVERIIEPIN